MLKRIPLAIIIYFMTFGTAYAEVWNTASTKITEIQLSASSDMTTPLLFVKMEEMIDPYSCNNPTWILLDASTPASLIFSEIYTSLLLAKATGGAVMYSVLGCSIGGYPLLGGIRSL